MTKQNVVEQNHPDVARVRRLVMLLMTSLATTVFLGCLATAPALNTSSGKPEISTSATTAAIKKAIELEMVNIGFLLTSSQENAVVFEGDADKFTTFMNTNSYTGAKPKARYRANIIDMSTVRRVLLTKWNITAGTSNNPSQEMEVKLPSQLQEMQSLLDKIKISLGGTTSGVDNAGQAAQRPELTPAVKPPTAARAPTIAQSESAIPAVAASSTERMSVSEAQTILASIGYQPGPADGSMGKRTVDALLKFQRDSKIAATGKVDAGTSQKLRAAKRPS